MAILPIMGIMGICRPAGAGPVPGGRLGLGVAVVAAMAMGGCANFSARITGTPRAGSEQLLLTGTADRAIACLDFRPLAGARVYLDTSRVAAADAGWVIFGLRRAMARQGLLLVDERREAAVIVEAAVAAYGTDEVDRRLSTPNVVPTGPIPIPAANLGSYAFGRKSRQDAVVKLALVGFDAATRRLIWESGTVVDVETFDRRFIGPHEIRRSSTLPELERYPRRSR